MPSSPATTRPACPQCHLSNPAGSKFCKKCGTPLSAPEVREAAPEAQREASLCPLPEDRSAQADGEATSPGLSTGLLARLKRAKSDPSVLLDRAHGKFSFLELLGVLVVCALFVGLYALGLLKFGPGRMLRSGAPAFLAYVIGLLVVLKTFRGLLDKVFMKGFQWLGRFSPRVRVLVGLALPVAYTFWSNVDRDMGFQTASFTVTVATLISHILIRSAAFKKALS